MAQLYGPAAPQARFLVMYDTPSDVDAFECPYNDVHLPLARQLPGLRRYTLSHVPAPVRGEPYYMIAMLDWDDMAALEAAFGSAIGQRTTRPIRLAVLRAGPELRAPEAAADCPCGCHPRAGDLDLHGGGTSCPCQ